MKLRPPSGATGPLDSSKATFRNSIDEPERDKKPGAVGGGPFLNDPGAKDQDEEAGKGPCEVTFYIKVMILEFGQERGCVCVTYTCI